MLGGLPNLGYPPSIIGTMVKHGCTGDRQTSSQTEETPDDVKLMDEALAALKVYSPEIYQSIWLFVTKPNPNYTNDDRARNMKCTRISYAKYLTAGRAFLSGRLLSFVVLV